MPPYVSVAAWANASYNRDDIRFRAVSAARCYDSDAIAVKRDMQPGVLWIVNTVQPGRQTTTWLSFQSFVCCFPKLNQASVVSR